MVISRNPKNIIALSQNIEKGSCSNTWTYFSYTCQTWKTWWFVVRGHMTPKNLDIVLHTRGKRKVALLGDNCHEGKNELAGEMKIMVGISPEWGEIPRAGQRISGSQHSLQTPNHRWRWGEKICSDMCVKSNFGSDSEKVKVFNFTEELLTCWNSCRWWPWDPGLVLDSLSSFALTGVPLPFSGGCVK